MPTALTAFEAIGDGVHDNAVAFARAGESGEALAVPAGVFRSSVPLVLRNHSATITGEGPGRSVIERVGGGNAVVVDLYQDDHPTESRRSLIERIRLVGGDLIVRGTKRQLGTKMATVRDVVAEGGGFWFNDCWGLRLDTVHANRPRGDAYLLTGYCVDTTLTACYAIGGGFKVLFTGWGDGSPEGVSLYNCHALAAEHGLFYDARTLTSPDGTEFLCPWLSVDTCHFNVMGKAGESSGMTVHRGSALFLTNNLIFHVYLDNGAMFHGINLQGCAEGRLAGNSVYTGSLHQAQVGIYAGGKALSLVDNRLQLTHDGDIGIRVPAEADDIRCRDNWAPAGRERQLYDVAPEARRVQGVTRALTPAFGPEGAWEVAPACVESLDGRQVDGRLEVSFYVAGACVRQEATYLTMGLPGPVLRRAQSVGHGWYGGRAAQFLIAAHPGERHLRLYTLDMRPWQVDGGVYLGGQIAVEVDA